MTYVNLKGGKIKDVRGTYENIQELIANITPRNREYTIIQMLPFQVRGEGYECSKMLIKSISSVNLFGARSLDVDKKYVKLSREECKVLVTTRKCENREMHCDASGRECSHDGTPTPIYDWLSTSVQTGVSCHYRIRTIVAIDVMTSCLELIVSQRIKNVN